MQLGISVLKYGFTALKAGFGFGITVAGLL